MLDEVCEEKIDDGDGEGDFEDEAADSLLLVRLIALVLIKETDDSVLITLLFTENCLKFPLLFGLLISFDVERLIFFDCSQLLLENSLVFPTYNVMVINNVNTFIKKLSFKETSKT